MSNPNRQESSATSPKKQEGGGATPVAKKTGGKKESGGSRKRSRSVDNPSGSCHRIYNISPTGLVRLGKIFLTARENYLDAETGEVIGVTMFEVARITGVNTSTLSQFENGLLTTVGFELVYSLAAFLRPRKHDGSVYCIEELIEMFVTYNWRRGVPTVKSALRRDTPEGRMIQYEGIPIHVVSEWEGLTTAKMLICGKQSTVYMTELAELDKQKPYIYRAVLIGPDGLPQGGDVYGIGFLALELTTLIKQRHQCHPALNPMTVTEFLKLAGQESEEVEQPLMDPGKTVTRRKRRSNKSAVKV